MPGIIKRNGTVMVVSGPSGSGKSTLCGKLRELLSDLEFSVSCTTRSPRPGEQNGVHYHFITKEEFEKRIAANEFIEYAKVFDNYYGTLYSEVADRIKAGRDVLLDIDVQGAMQIRKHTESNDLLKKCTEFVFIAPPSYAILEQRLRKRGTEEEEVVKKRLAESSKEMEFWNKYDYLILNDHLEDALDEFHSLVKSFRINTKRIPDIGFYYGED